jgi:hypothetical protein
MFFSVSKTPQLNFSANWNYHGWCIDTDQGWNVIKHNDCALIYKGYVDDGDLHSAVTVIANEATGLRSGNFCLLIVGRDSVQVQHSKVRSFPVWYGDKIGITNLRPLERRIYADAELILYNDLSFVTNKIEILSEVKLHTQSRSTVISAIDEILTARFTKFAAHNQLPVKIFLSGGIDTALMYSYIKKLNIPHELVLAEHIEFDQFWVCNHWTITETHWAYKQLHHWRQPTVLVSGCPGDEFSLRNPLMANMLALYHQCTITDLLDWNQNEHYLHRSYFDNKENMLAMEAQRHDPDLKPVFTDWDQLGPHLLDRAANDHQHWHLGNTLTFTPMRDLEILKLMLNLPWRDQVSQMLDSAISKELIKLNSPDILDILSVQKNTGNYLENLVHLL